MRVAIEALGIDVTGGGRSATLNLLHALFSRDRESAYAVVLTRPEPTLARYPNVDQLVSGPIAGLRSRLWAQTLLPVFLRAWGATLVHHVKNLTIAGAPCPAVVTVHDDTTLRHPELFPRAEVWYWRYVQPLALRAATRVVTISHCAAAELAESYRLPPDKLTVVYDSYAPIFTPTAGDPAAVRRRYAIDGTYVLHVGSISKKKNLTTLVRAFARLRRRGVVDKLVLVGRVYQKGQDGELPAVVEAEGLVGDVVFTGSVPDDDLPGLYRGAAATAFPSLHEGFGMVPIEAMACGTPVVTSRGGALPEVVGDAALTMTDTLDHAELAALLERAIRDQPCRRELIARGYERARLFTPERAADATLTLYRQVAAG